uniref:zinc finger protein ZFPM1-like isoform X2 n=1 Tax=Styela clava TaxID=7725 RepID=UPI001939477A|nr:zinc finger protein ZFPM1-like isoform X2 [Styela clava]
MSNSMRKREFCTQRHSSSYFLEDLKALLLIVLSLSLLLWFPPLLMSSRLPRLPFYMPGTEFAITDNKIRLAVSPSRPQIKLESVEEKRAVKTFEMTPTTSNESVNLTQNAPSSVASQRDMLSNGYVSPVDKMTDCDSVVESLPGNNSPIPAERPGMTKTTKSASCGSLSSSSPVLSHQTNRCRRVSAGTVDFTKVKTEYSSMNTNELHIAGEIQNGSRNETQLSPFRANGNADEESPKRMHSPNSEQIPRKQLYQRHHSAADLFNTPMIALERKHECSKCGITFRNKDTYEVHSKHYCSGKRRDIQCHLCEAKFDDEKRLQIHMEVHSLQYICLLCSQRMPTPATCQNHMQLHAENLKVEQPKDGLLPCPSCDLTFGQKSDLVLHLCSQHVTVGNLPQFLYPPIITNPMDQPSSSSLQQQVINRSLSENSNDSSSRDIHKTPPRDNLDDVDLHNISPPVITSTPSRPTGDSIINSVPVSQNAFSCIVCGLGFPDVITLQRHLLTTHTTLTSQKAPSPLQPPPPPMKPPQRQTNRLNCRKVSTVSAPQLSLLSGSVSPAFSRAMQPKLELPKTSTSPAEANRYSPDSSEDVRNKKRKESSNMQEMDNGDQLHQGLKRAKRDVSFLRAKPEASLKVANDSFETRRVSCPAVANKMLAAEQLGLSAALFGGPSEEERNCIQCDIRFSSAANYRAHKKYYCASRHMHKVSDDGQIGFLAPHPQSDDLPESTEFLSTKSRKRNAGNRSSMTYRKRSHLTPLETVRNSPPCQEASSSTVKMNSVRKSCPSHLEPTDTTASKSPSPNRENSPNPALQVTKKHLCQECNIWFSKYDTYMAHKKYYCESRRKDRVSVRSLHASTKIPLKRKSESNLRESIARSGNSLFVPEHISWSPQRSTPSTDPEDDRSTMPNQLDPSSKIERKLSSASENTSMPFPMYGQMDPDMLARISFMQPLILNQYLTMLRERMAQGIQNTGLLFPTLPFTNIPATRSLTPTETTRKSSTDETRNGRLSTSPCSSNTKPQSSNARPTRQSCVAAINVKKEPIDNIRLSPENRITPRLRASPLDLSNKLEESHLLSTSRSSPMPPYPTIDLRTTALAIVKQEPKSDFPSTDSLNNKTSESGLNIDNDNNSNNKAEASRPNSRPEIRISNSEGFVSVTSQEKDDVPNSAQKSRAQHCKNCDARFTSLSTFIAHKKYYCSGTNNGGLIRNDAKAAQMAH